MEFFPWLERIIWNNKSKNQAQSTTVNHSRSSYILTTDFTFQGVLSLTLLNSWELEREEVLTKEKGSNKGMA